MAQRAVLRLPGRESCPTFFIKFACFAGVTIIAVSPRLVLRDRAPCKRQKVMQGEATSQPPLGVESSESYEGRASQRCPHPGGSAASPDRRSKFNSNTPQSTKYYGRPVQSRGAGVSAHRCPQRRLRKRALHPQEREH